MLGVPRVDPLPLVIPRVLVAWGKGKTPMDTDWQHPRHGCSEYTVHLQERIGDLRSVGTAKSIS